MPVAKLDRLSRRVAFISAQMDSRGFDLAIAAKPGANRLALHPPLQSTSDGRTRNAFAAKARGIKLGNPKQAEINRAKAAEQAQSLAPAHRHIERCIEAGRGWFGLRDDPHPSHFPGDRLAETNPRVDIWTLLRCGALTEGAVTELTWGDHGGSR